MNLDDLLNEMSEKMRNRDLSDEYLREHNNPTREEIGIGEYAYGITMIPCEWVYKYLSEYKKTLKENEKLKEYIAIAPNLDEMTAIKYRNIQQDAYIQGRAEEQKKAGQIIYENYIPIQKIKDKIEEIKAKMGKDCIALHEFQREAKIDVLQELLEKEKIK